MQYQVLVQNLPDGLFSAFVIGVPDVVAEGATVEEALNNAKTLLKERLATSRLFTIEVEEVNILGDVDLYERYKHSIPVIAIASGPTLSAPIRLGDLERALAEAQPT